MVSDKIPSIPAYYFRFKYHEDAHDVRDDLRDDGIYATFPPEEQPENGDWVLRVCNEDIDKSPLSVPEFEHKYVSKHLKKSCNGMWRSKSASCN